MLFLCGDIFWATRLSGVTSGQSHVGCHASVLDGDQLKQSIEVNRKLPSVELSVGLFSDYHPIDLTSQSDDNASAVSFRIVQFFRLQLGCTLWRSFLPCCWM